MIDTSLWKRDEKSQASGTRAKFWLLEPETDLKIQQGIFSRSLLKERVVIGPNLLLVKWG